MIELVGSAMSVRGKTVLTPKREIPKTSIETLKTYENMTPVHVSKNDQEREHKSNRPTSASRMTSIYHV